MSDCQCGGAGGGKCKCTESEPKLGTFEFTPYDPPMTRKDVERMIRKTVREMILELVDNKRII